MGNGQIRVGQDNSAWLEIEVSGGGKALSTSHVTGFTVHCLRTECNDLYIPCKCKVRKRGFVAYT